MGADTRADEVHSATLPDAVDGGGGGDLLSGLNEAQLRAVTHPGGPLLILAGAGSGKTRAITTRIAWLVAEQGVPPGAVLAITFTNKAAREMRERVQRLIPATGAWISTFHAMGARILRREIEHLPGYTRDFAIYDTYDRNQLLKQLVSEAGYDPARFRPAAVGGWISDVKNGVREAPAPDDPGQDAEVERVVSAAYATAMRAHNALDFDDLLLKVREVFTAQPGLRDLYAQRFRHVLVDEYQDTNRVQYQLVRDLAGAHRNLTVCGDPDQSIYAWRGADLRNILDFERDFAEPGRPVAVVRLEQNYRSTELILRAAQGLIRHNRARYEKDLWSARAGGERIVARECADEEDEAREVAHQLHAAIELGRRPDQIAVLYRVNYMQRALETALRLAGIPYQVVGGTEFYQRREIRDLVSYLVLAVNPSADLCCERVLNVPARGIGEKSAADLSAWAKDRGVPLARAVRSPEARALVKGKARAGLERFAALLDVLESLREAPAAEALERVLAETGYLDHLAGLGDADEVDRQENVEELRAHAARWDELEPEGKLRGFLQDVALVSETDGFDQDVPRVALMTAHAAKGLEFELVVIAGLEEELFPHARALSEAGDQEAAVEEERRLLYVALTRAKERVLLTWARTRRHYSGAPLVRAPSRFVGEIPEDALEGLEDAQPLASWSDERDDEPTYERVAIGDRVRHAHFGTGRVEALQGEGEGARASVRFERAGTKLLLLQYAGLERLGPDPSANADRPGRRR